MEITFILKGNFENLPPMLPRLIHVSQKQIKINLICTKIQDAGRKLLEKHGVFCTETLHNPKNRLTDWLGFHAACKKILRSVYPDTKLLYICSADTALCLNSILKEYDYILQSNELYDQIARYRYGLKKYVKKAKAFVVPEFCRANICTCWYGKKPYVIPNIPYLLSRETRQAVSDEKARNLIESLSGKKILLYQGMIKTGDRSLSAVAQALKKINSDEYALVLMGHNYNHSFEQLKEQYPKTYYIPFIPAPYHLEVTSHAHFALLSYDRVSLNNLFCAPNKIYEYSGLGIPMIGNDIPGLYYTVEHEKMGVCCSYEAVDEIVAAIKKIENNYTQYARNSRAFFEKSNLGELMDHLLRDVLGDSNLG